MAASSSSSAASEALIQSLVSRGWCFGDVEQVKSLIAIQCALHGDSCTVDLVESELANMDLRSIGGKSLPDPSVLRKASNLQGPKVLQISSVRDISRSTISDNSGTSNHRRLLRLTLTDGHFEITAIEYTHIPSVGDDVIPGTKVRLVNKAAIRSGIVCLNPKVIIILGGVVQSLYEEWQMNQKYSGFSRSSLRISKESESGGPPPFEKLQISALSRQAPQSRYSQYSGSTSKISRPTILASDRSAGSKQIGARTIDPRADARNGDVKPTSATERAEEQPSRSEARPREVVDSVPIQNQAAAQKLLQKMNQPNRDDRHFRGRKHRGKEKEDDSMVFTLDEWERRKGGGIPSVSNELPSVSQDEDLARQLQNQFDLEDIHIQRVPHGSEAENIKMSMFSFQRDDATAHDRGFRGRGRGRARGRGRGRGRFG